MLRRLLPTPSPVPLTVAPEPLSARPSRVHLPSVHTGVPVMRRGLQTLSLAEVKLVMGVGTTRPPTEVRRMHLGAQTLE